MGYLQSFLLRAGDDFALRGTINFLRFESTQIFMDLLSIRQIFCLGPFGLMIILK